MKDLVKSSDEVTDFNQLKLLLCERENAYDALYLLICCLRISIMAAGSVKRNQCRCKQITYTNNSYYFQET